MVKIPQYPHHAAECKELYAARKLEGNRERTKRITGRDWKRNGKIRKESEGNGKVMNGKEIRRNWEEKRDSEKMIPAWLVF
ncbi:MAG: hypothetical protein K6A82_03515 [Prevotella sp.]|nr:hypothetical protein [Prevotella sp.]